MCSFSQELAEILRLNAIIQVTRVGEHEGIFPMNMFVFSILRTWQNIFEVFQLMKNVSKPIIVHKKEEL